MVMNKFINHHPVPCFSQMSHGHGGGQPETLHIPEAENYLETTGLFNLHHLQKAYSEKDKGA